MMVLGLLGITVVTSGAIFITRRRRSPEEDPDAVGEAPPLVVTLRPVGRADGLHVEDPILAAMGLGATSQPDPNAPIARSVHFGPGERPAPPGKRAHRSH